MQTSLSPWRVEKKRHGAEIRNAEGYIASITGWDDSVSGDAQLIAAAPDLRDALWNLVHRALKSAPALLETHELRDARQALIAVGLEP